MTGTPPDLWLLLASGVTLVCIGRRRSAQRRPEPRPESAAAPAKPATGASSPQLSAPA